MVEWDEIKDLALACNPAIEEFLITSRRTVMHYIHANFELYTSQLRETFQTAISMVHISSDLWSSPHCHSMLTVCAQWVDSKYQLRKALLGMPECYKSHSGEAQATAIASVLYNFRIIRIGYHIGDNASSNNTCLVTLAEKLQDEHRV
jgi:hypothetical protein